MKKWLSYLWPISEKRSSDHSGVVELSWINGKRLLNSSSANYSYGRLQKVLEIGLREIDFLRVNSICVLGVGGGSVVYSIRDRFNYRSTIVGVEHDEVILNIALEDYGLKEDAKFYAAHNSADDFVERCDDKFDLVIIDLFIDTNVPTFVYQTSFWKGVRRILSNNGQVLFNAGIYDYDSDLRNSLIEKLQSEFRLKILNEVIGINTLLILEKI